MEIITAKITTREAIVKYIIDAFQHFTVEWKIRKGEVFLIDFSLAEIEEEIEDRGHFDLLLKLGISQRLNEVAGELLSTNLTEIEEYSIEDIVDKIEFNEEQEKIIDALKEKFKVENGICLETK